MKKLNISILYLFDTEEGFDKLGADGFFSLGLVTLVPGQNRVKLKLQSTRFCLPLNIANCKLRIQNKILKKKIERKKQRERVGNIYLFTDTKKGAFVHELIEESLIHQYIIFKRNRYIVCI